MNSANLAQNQIPWVVSYLVHLGLFGLALWIGGRWTGPGVVSEWYRNLHLPPWQPPGWAFGLAWTLILFTFPIALAFWVPVGALFTLSLPAILFWTQWIFNILWNYLFFGAHLTGLSGLEIVVLTAVVALMAIGMMSLGWGVGLAALPYLGWLCVATSLNGYIWLKN